MFILSNLASLPDIARAESRATASVRIERPTRASRHDWEQSPKSSRREIILRDERQQPTLVRIIDHE